LSKKNSEKIFEDPMEKIYHIYAKNKCIFHSLKEEEFRRTWNQLNSMVGLMKTDYTTEDLSYEEAVFLSEHGGGPYDSPSY
jgi:hypothetical protein